MSHVKCQIQEMTLAPVDRFPLLHVVPKMLSGHISNTQSHVADLYFHVGSMSHFIFKKLLCRRVEVRHQESSQ